MFEKSIGSKLFKFKLRRVDVMVMMTLLAMKRDIPFEQSHTIEVDNATPIEFSIEELEEIRKKL